MKPERIAFLNEEFDWYSYEDVPLDRDIFLVDGTQLEAYRDMMLRFFSGEEYDYKLCPVTPVAARTIRNDSIELSWYPNVYDRFHEVVVNLPRSAFLACVGSWRSDEKPRVFVDSSWLKNLHLRNNSIFALVDAAGMKGALLNGSLKREALLKIREEIDLLAANYEEVLFISFADSVLLKSSWNPSYVNATTKYKYNPELFLHLAKAINQIYIEALGLDTYMILSQGTNEFYNDPLHHVSDAGNHISLNSLGIPFAVLMDIEAAARSRIRSGDHQPAELYLDESFLRSLRLKFSFEKNSLPSFQYQTKMSRAGSLYYLADRDGIISNIKGSEQPGA